MWNIYTVYTVPHTARERLGMNPIRWVQFVQADTRTTAYAQFTAYQPLQREQFGQSDMLKLCL